MNSQLCPFFLRMWVIHFPFPPAKGGTNECAFCFGWVWGFYLLILLHKQTQAGFYLADSIVRNVCAFIK